MKIDFSKLYLIPRESIANAFFYASMLLAFFGSMNVWFLLPVATFFPIMSFILGLSAFIISRPLDKQIFCSSDALFPTIAFIILLFYQAVVNDNNVNTYIKALFNSAVLSYLRVFPLPHARRHTACLLPHIPIISDRISPTLQRPRLQRRFLLFLKLLFLSNRRKIVVLHNTAFSVHIP